MTRKKRGRFFDLSLSRRLDGARFFLNTMKLQMFFSIRDVRERFHPSRCARWIKDTFRNGEYGPVLRDAPGWLISEDALLEYQRRHVVGSESRPPASDRQGNLVQFKKSSRL